MKKTNKNTPTKTIFQACAWMITGMFVISVVMHLVCLNMLATKGYALKSIESKTAHLLEEDKQLRIDEARLTSLYRVEREMEHLTEALSNDAETVYATGRFAFREDE